MPKAHLKPGINDLQSQFPDISKEWHREKNGELSPADVCMGSHKKVWWRCSKNVEHEWEGKVCNRTSKNQSGCPICKGRKVVSNENSLESRYRELAREWHPSLNKGLEPSDVRTNSHKKVFWQCRVSEEHIWESRIFARTRYGHGCPYCSGLRVLKGFNDLRTTHPEIAVQWHQNLNGTLMADEVSAGSSKKVYWQCSEYPDHHWQAIVNSRTNGGWGCPICSGLKTMKGFNDLVTTHPQIAAEWHPVLNGILMPTGVSRGCNTKVFWKCSKHENHIWKASVASRTSDNAGCPVCSGYQTLKGFNDIQTTHPDIAADWHPTLNGKLKPTDITAGSKVKVFWQCRNFADHVWHSTVANKRVSRNGCSICSGHTVLIGFNDLNTTDPDIAKEWHPTKNKTLNPTSLTRGSAEKVWWECTKDNSHIWKAQVKARTLMGHGCPDCSEGGFKQSELAWFYLMQRPGEQQLGITNDLEGRFKTHMRNGWEALDWTREPAPGKLVYETESRFKKWLRKEIGVIKGTTENWATTSMEVQTLSELKKRSGLETDLF
jgi:predicted GIY-YIG superfamily endonuclease